MLNIRPLVEDDIEAVLHISQIAWAPVFQSFEEILGAEIYHLVFPHGRKEQLEMIEAMCREEAETTQTFVAEVVEHIAGFIIWKLDLEAKSGEIWFLAVHPDYQNQGIATKLNLFALDKMREAGMTLAIVGTGGDPSHAPARRAYEKAGMIGLPTVRYYKAL